MERESRALTPGRLLRFPEVQRMTGLSRSTIWRLERAQAFPRHVRLSPNAVVLTVRHCRRLRKRQALLAPMLS